MKNTHEPAVFDLFPTVCFRKQHTDLDELNAALVELILKQEQDGQPIKRVSLVGGYRSDRAFFEQDHWAVQQLAAMVKTDLAEYYPKLMAAESQTPDAPLDLDAIDLWGWSMLLREGDLITAHVHKKVNIVGAYFLHSTMSDDSPNAGNIVMCDPRVRAWATPVDEQRVTANMAHTTGTLMMFPGYMEHYVLPFKGPGMRISIAINIRFHQ